ncbi:hypothetical protein MTO96_049960 [Rhipicephalus appendiculatus]
MARIDHVTTESESRARTRGIERELEWGNLVIVKDDNVPTLQWKLGRVVEAFPGRDGIEKHFKITFSIGQQVRRATPGL